MIFDYKDGAGLPALGVFLVGLRILLGLDRLTHTKRMLVIGFCVGAAAVLLFIGTISPDRSTSTPPVGLSPLYGQVIMSTRKRRRKKFGSRMERKAASLAKKKQRAAKKAARKLRAIAKSARNKGRLRSTKLVSTMLLKSQRKARETGSRLVFDAATESWIEQIIIGTNRTAARFRAPLKRGDTPLGPTPGGKYPPRGETLPSSGSIRSPYKKAAIGAAVFGAGIVAEQTVNLALDYMFSRLPDAMSPYRQRFSKEREREGVGVYYRNQLIGQMTRETYKLLRMTATRAVQNKLRAM